MRKTFGLIVYGTVLSLALGEAALAQGGPPPASVVVETARIVPLAAKRPVTGELLAARRALLASEADGIVVACEVDEGMAIAAGARLLQLDTKLADLELQRVRAEAAMRRGAIGQRQAELEKANRDMTRAQALVEKQAATATDVDDARTQVRIAEAMLEQAYAALAVAETAEKLADRRVKEREVRAPFACTVVSVRTEVGQWIRTGEAVAEVVDLSAVEAWLQVPEAEADRLRASGASVTVLVPELGLTMEAKVSATVPAADPLARLFPIICRIANPDGRLRPGMRVTGLVPTGRDEPVLAVHKDAVRRDDAGSFVFFDAGGKAAVARIEPMYAVGDLVAVRSQALADGANVVVEGNERLFPGRPLAARFRDGSTAAPAPAPAPAPATAPAPAGPSGSAPAKS